MAAMAWLFAEISGAREPSQHDLKLFEIITAKLPERILDFLRNHDFGASYNDPGFAGVYDVAAWQGPRQEFIDKSLQKRWGMVQIEVTKFANGLSLNTFPEGNADNWFTVHPTHGDPEIPEDFVQRRIDLLNRTATELAGHVDTFEHFARSRLKL